MITKDGAIFAAPGRGRKARGAAGAATTIKATSQDTKGIIAAFEQLTPGQTGPPLHTHRRCAESFYVASGTFSFEVGDRRLTAPAGSFLFVPRGVPHTYRNAGKRPARILFWFTPGLRMERYFEELGRIPSKQLNADRLNRIAKDHGVAIVSRSRRTSTARGGARP